jgi:hypothetical protein
MLNLSVVDCGSGPRGLPFNASLTDLPIRSFVSLVCIFPLNDGGFGLSVMLVYEINLLYDIPEMCYCQEKWILSFFYE